MLYQKFIVERYRAIDSAEVTVGNKLIPIIGVNESGKTSILKAILSFDRNSDGVGSGDHLNYKNKYDFAADPCVISAEVLIDSEEDIDAISEKLKIPRGNDLIKSLESILESKQPILISRNLETKKYSVDGFDLAPKLERKFAVALYELLPLILYFDDFTDRVPEILNFIVPEGAPYKIRNNRIFEWQRILEEVFLRGTQEKYNLQQFLAIKDRDDQEGLLNDINDVLNKEIMQDWKRLKGLGGNLSDDHDELELKLNYIPGESKSFDFQFKVLDRSRSNQRIFNVVDRSKGYQWFFNFLMKLKFNHKYQRSKSDAIYLLDEPGSYLHSSAQEELLNELDSISRTNTILFCTHSQHLLNPETINISQSRIASKEDGKVRVLPFGKAEIKNYQGALTPFFHALQLKTGVFNRDIKKVLITEGITDFYLFTMMSEHLKGWDFSNISIIPGAGADQLKELISWSIAWSAGYLVLLDSDAKGLDAKAKYTNFFGERESANISTYRTPNKDSDIVLEKLLTKVDQKRIMEATGAKFVKNAITELFFMSDSVKKKYFQKLDESSVTKLSVIRKQLSELNGGQE